MTTTALDRAPMALTEDFEVYRDTALEWMAAQTDACRKRKIAVYAYYCTTWDNFLAESHPEWLVIKRDRSNYLPKFDQTPGWTALCLAHAPFVDLMLAHERVHGAALNRPRANQRDLDHQVVEPPRLQARQETHLRPRLHLEHPDRIGPAQHVVDRCLLLRDRVEAGHPSTSAEQGADVAGWLRHGLRPPSWVAG